MLFDAILRTTSRKTNRGIRDAKRALAFERVLARRHFAAVKKAKHLAGQTGLKLHLACGKNIKNGWINIDLFKRKADLRLDLRETFPFEDSSVEIIYSEHFFEHLEYPGEVGHVLKESLRVLQPGGRFSVSVPDAVPMLEAYVHNNTEAFRICRERWHPSWCDTHMHQLNYFFRQGNEHKYAWDFETLAKVLETAGFRPVGRRVFDLELDLESRRDGSLYLEAHKPVVAMKAGIRSAA